MKFLFTGLLCWLFLPFFAESIKAQPPPGAKSSATILLQALESSQYDQTRLPLVLSSHLAEVNESLWQSVIALGVSAREARDFVRSHYYFAAAQQIAQLLSNQQLEGLAGYQRGLTYTAQVEVDASLQSYLQSRTLLQAAQANEHLVYVLADLGALYLYQQDYLQAKEFSTQSLTLAAALPATILAASPRPEGRGIALLNLGEAARREDNNSQALSYLRQALSHFQSLAQSNSRWRNEVSEAQAEIGRIYRTQGNYLEALAYLNQALALIRLLPARNQQADTLNSIGVLYLEQENYEPATTAFHEALTLYRQVQDTHGTATILLNLAIIEQRQQHFGAAINGFQEAESVARTVNDLDVVITALTGQGAIKTAQGQYTAAQATLEGALAGARTVNYRYREAEILWRLAQNYYATGDFPHTIALATQARDLAQQIQYAKLLSLANTTLGQGYLGLADPMHAKAAFLAAVTTIEELRQNLSAGPAGAQLFLAERTAPYQALALLALAEHDEWAALNWTERAKARTLFDLVSQAERLADTGTKPLNKSARAPWPTLDSSNAQLLLRQEPRTVYLSYLVTPQETYLFVVTGDASSTPTLRVIPLLLPAAQLTTQVQKFQNLLAARKSGFSPLGQTLYAKLLLPARPYLPAGATLAFAPDGPLWDLPFQALMSTPDRYLLDDYALFYTPSLSFLTALEGVTRASVNTPVSLLALGNPVSTPETLAVLRRTFGSLPDAGREVQSLVSLLGPGGRSQVLLQAQASETAFKTLAPQFRLLHLATHGVVNPQKPLHSYLTLTPSAGPVLGDDGLLEAWEVMNMSLQADLTVLSACESGVGSIRPGEGVIGLSWAFLVAGSKTVIASRWAVNSSSTGRLMTGFYQSRQKAPMAVAWRSAALSLKANTQYTHPHYWASFGILGVN